MNEAVKVLTHEHETIKRAINQTNALFADILNGNKDIKAMHERIDFFRKYADGYHHHKEEEVLFPEMIKRNEMLEYGVIHEMLQNHEDFREMLAEIETLVNEGNATLALSKFKAYSEALLEHIAVEDEEVFQIAETLLSEDELLTVLYRFEDCDRELGVDAKKDWEDTIE
ncbi:MAG: hemerythrin domain-containing protein [Chitinophagales bacterium]|nr:hemerythrin domain-containing protein [Bacteroidia bacterium]MCZ2394107.1 hemerythrin domain-containing protein [Chitinophagales bacterium]